MISWEGRCLVAFPWVLHFLTHFIPLQKLLSQISTLPQHCPPFVWCPMAFSP